MAADALVLMVRQGGRVVPVRALVATGVNAYGRREILRIQVTTKRGRRSTVAPGIVRLSEPGLKAFVEPPDHVSSRAGPVPLRAG